MSERVRVISGYGAYSSLTYGDYAKLINSNDNYHILHQGSLDNLPKRIIIAPQFKKTKHSGANISDYLLFIIDNYPYFPKEVAFLKSNMLQRHIPEDVFNRRMQSSGFVSLYSETSSYKPTYSWKRGGKFIGQQVAPGIFLEVSNNWYVRSIEKGLFFPKIEDMFNKFISKEPLPKYIPFVPGACMVVESSKITRWPKSMYIELYEAVTSQAIPSPMPVEAYHVERLMLYFFLFEKY